MRRELSSIDYSKELTVSASPLVDDEKANGKQWGKDWWWRQDGSGELCSKDYVMEWIGSQICPSNADWDDGKNNVHAKVELENSNPKDKDHDAIAPQPQVFGIGHNTTDNGVEKKESRGKKYHKKKHRKMQEWWKEEHLAELSKKTSKLKNLHTKWKKDFVRRDTGSRKCGCPFKLRGKPVVGGQGWMVKLMCGSHNHELTKSLVGHPYA